MTAILASVIALTMMIVTIVLVIPSDSAVKKQVQAIAAPYFSQNWRVFAPSIMKSDFSLEMRAQWRDESDKLVKTGWVSITDIESQIVHGNIAPSRIQKSSWNAVQAYRKRYQALEPEQQKRVRDSFIERTNRGFQPTPDSKLRAELGDKDRDVVRFLRMDYMLMRYTTLYAVGGFGKDVERVQWRITVDRPNDFQHRFRDERQFMPSITTFGWRQSNVDTSDEVVVEYEALIRRMGMENLFEEALKNGG